MQTECCRLAEQNRALTVKFQAVTGENLALNEQVEKQQVSAEAGCAWAELRHKSGWSMNLQAGLTMTCTPALQIAAHMIGLVVLL